MNIKFMLSAEVDSPYIQTLEALVEDNIYVVAEFVDINKIPAKTIKRIKSFPGAFNALLIARKNYCDALASIKVDGEYNEH